MTGAHKQEPGSRLVGEREERLREALEPFVKSSEDWQGDNPALDGPKHPFLLEVLTTDVVRARAALASSPSPPDRAGFVREEKAVDYPYKDGDVLVLGPEVFVSSDGTVICWKGQNYERQPDSDVLEPEDFRDPAVGRGDES